MEEWVFGTTIGDLKGDHHKDPFPPPSFPTKRGVRSSELRPELRQNHSGKGNQVTILGGRGGRGLNTLVILYLHSHAAMLS